MKTLSRVLLVGVVAVSLSLCRARAASAQCSTSTLMTYFGGYLDDHNPGSDGVDVVFIYWGWDIYGDPQNFQASVESLFDNEFSFLHTITYGIPGTRFYGVNTQYSGKDWTTQSVVSGVPNLGGTRMWAYHDDSFLPSPDANGNIALSETNVQNEINNISAGVGGGSATGDTIIVLLLPPNASVPVSGLCGRHYTTSGTPGGALGAWIGYPGSAGCGGSTAFQQHAIVHELVETEANPAWNDGVSFEGWDQGSGAFCETGDICNFNQFTIQTQATDVTGAVSQITTQQFFSNEAATASGNGCVYGRATDANYFELHSDNQLYVGLVNAGTALTIFNPTSWGKPTGVTLTGSPAGAVWRQNYVDAFVRDTAGNMYHAWKNPNVTTPAWEKLTSTTAFTQSPDAISWGAGNVQVFGVQGNNIVKNTKDGGGAWSGWQAVNRTANAQPRSKVTVTSWGASALSGFPTTNRTVVAAYRASDGKVYIGNSANGGTFTWKGFTPPATLTGDLDIAAWAPPRLDLFVLDTSGNLWDMASNDGGTTIASSTNWGHATGATFNGGPGVAGLGDGRLIVGGPTSGGDEMQLWNWHGTSWVKGDHPVGGFDIASRE